MRLLFKTFVFIFIGMLGTLAVNAALMVRREIRLFDSDMRNDELLLGHAMEPLVSDAWAASGEERVLGLLGAANRDQNQVSIRWVWLDAAGEDPHAPLLPLDELAPVLRGEDLSVKQGHAREGGRRLTYVPVAVATARRGAIELNEPLSRLRAYTRETIYRASWLVVLMAAVVLALMSIVGVRFVGRPLAALVERTRRIGAGDFGGAVTIKGRDELARLGRAMNRMSEQLAAAHAALIKETEARIEALEHLRHTERLSQIGHLAAGIAHELGTPLNVVAGRAKLIASGSLEPAEVVDFAGTIGEQTERMTGIIRQLLDFARRRPSQRTPTSLATLAEHVVDMLRPGAGKAGIALELRGAAALPPVPIDAAQIQQVLINLVMNGIQAMPAGGKLVLALDRRPAGQPSRDCVVVEVIDQGLGIAPEHLKLIFDPFFTTKEVGRGTGLGLSISHGIIADHGGWIGVESERGRGSRFTVFLPTEESRCAAVS